MKKNLVLAMAAASLAAGCMGAAEHRAAVQGEGDRLTVGKVQREIKVGMPGSEVVRVLGSPNIVTTDEERREVWVYDRVATDMVYSESRGGAMALVFVTGDGLAGAAPGYQAGSGARSTTQRTLTVVIKFDKESRVRDFSYHASQF